MINIRLLYRHDMVMRQCAYFMLIWYCAYQIMLVSNKYADVAEERSFAFALAVFAINLVYNLFGVYTIDIPDECIAQKSSQPTLSA